MARDRNRASWNRHIPLCAMLQSLAAGLSTVLRFLQRRLQVAAESLDLLSRLAGRGGQRLDLLRDDIEPAAELAGAGRLDPGVERQHLQRAEHREDVARADDDLATDLGQMVDDLVVLQLERLAILDRDDAAFEVLELPGALEHAAADLVDP